MDYFPLVVSLSSVDELGPHAFDPEITQQPGGDGDVKGAHPKVPVETAGGQHPGQVDGRVEGQPGRHQAHRPGKAVDGKEGAGEKQLRRDDARDELIEMVQALHPGFGRLFREIISPVQNLPSF